MALQFKIGQAVYRALPKSTDLNRWLHDVDSGDGFVVVTLDEKRIASFRRIYVEGNQLAANELKIRYRVRSGEVKFATNAFFFEEGQEKFMRQQNMVSFGSTQMASYSSLTWLTTGWKFSV